MVHEMAREPDGEVLISPEILEEEYLPADMPGREMQVTEMYRNLAVAAKNRKPRHLWLHGRQGVGKTSSARYVAQKLRREKGVMNVYVNCWKHMTLPAVMEEITDQLRAATATRGIGILGVSRTGARMNIERFRKFAGQKPLVIILDEIDAPAVGDMNAILYNLYDIGNAGLVCIASSRAPVLQMSDRVKSRLNPKTIAFENYTCDELLNILLLRADLALGSDCWNEVLLRKIARLARGDARVAIKALKNAAQAAEMDASGHIEIHHVEATLDDSRDWKKQYQLKGLTLHHNLVYEIIRGHEGILSADLWQTYLDECKKLGKRPVRERTFIKYRRKLLDMRLIESERVLGKRGNVNKFRACAC